jgi:hypothetical protein
MFAVEGLAMSSTRGESSVPSSASFFADVLAGGLIPITCIYCFRLSHRARVQRRNGDFFGSKQKALL